MLYTIQAQVSRPAHRGVISLQVPTFFLASQVQGIVDVEHAASLAYDLIETINPNCGIVVTACDEDANTYIMTAANRK
jgi:hypothetical protein